MNATSPVYKIIENQIRNNSKAISFFNKLSQIGLVAKDAEFSFKFDIHPICEFFSIPPGYHALKEGTKHPLNWDLIETCSALIGLLYPDTHMEHLMSFFQNLQKLFILKQPLKKEQPKLIANEFFDMFSIEEVVGLSKHLSPTDNLTANAYKHAILLHSDFFQSAGLGA